VADLEARAAEKILAEGERPTNISYQGALEAAGAKVLAFSKFGDYQGTWWAKVAFEGKVGWVTGSFGSCSGCDAIEGEFDSENATWPSFIEFGLRYLENIVSQEQVEQSATKDSEWDLEAEGVLRWLGENR